MKIIIKNSNELIHKGKQTWFKYKYRCVYNGKTQYFKNIQAAKNFHNKINESLKTKT